ncbi:MAG: type II CAAX prenyl endopeptidase Rce1 family protein [Candidatus Hodarchaeota archaeon]
MEDENISGEDKGIIEDIADKEVFFDIEKKSDGERKKAYNHLALMYKWHFLSFFIASIIGGVIMFTIYNYRVIFLLIIPKVRLVALNASMIPIAISVLLLIVLLEKIVYSKDTWTMERLGFVKMNSIIAKKSYVFGLIPLIFLIFRLISPNMLATSQFVLTVSTSLFILGSIPIIILEEIIFRGIYWKYILMKFGKNRILYAYLINGLLFSLIHLPTMFISYIDGIINSRILDRLIDISIMLLNAFIIGTSLAILRDSLNCIYAPIIFHLLYNIIDALLPVTLFGALWSIFIGTIIFVVLLSLSKWKKIRTSRDIPQEALSNNLKEVIQKTRFQKIFKFIYLIGCSLVAIGYYGYAMSKESNIRLIITIITMISSLSILSYAIIKQKWIFKMQGSQSN